MSFRICAKERFDGLVSFSPRIFLIPSRVMSWFEFGPHIEVPEGHDIVVKGGMVCMQTLEERVIVYAFDGSWGGVEYVNRKPVVVQNFNIRIGWKTLDIVPVGPWDVKGLRDPKKIVRTSKMPFENCLVYVYDRALNTR